jgi:hypothetical protein
MSRSRAGARGKRRTTLTLPADAIAQAKRLAGAKDVSLGTIVSQALTEGLRIQLAAERSRELLEAFRKPYEGLSDEEMMILDGVILEPKRRKR